jgi:hypothetical protein
MTIPADNGAFARAKRLFAIIAAAMNLADSGQRSAALHSIPEYTSNGKGKTAVHSKRMTRITQREAQKKRNIKANRRAHRG